MNTVYEYSARIGDIVGTDVSLPPEQDQKFTCTLLENGTLVMKFYRLEGTLVSRISLSLKQMPVVETFNEPNREFFHVRVNGNQNLPVVFPREEAERFMTAVDHLV